MKSHDHRLDLCTFPLLTHTEKNIFVKFQSKKVNTNSVRPTTMLPLSEYGFYNI